MSFSFQHRFKHLMILRSVEIFYDYLLHGFPSWWAVTHQPGKLCPLPPKGTGKGDQRVIPLITSLWGMKGLKKTLHLAAPAFGGGVGSHVETSADSPSLQKGKNSGFGTHLWFCNQKPGSGFWLLLLPFGALASSSEASEDISASPESSVATHKLKKPLLSLVVVQSWGSLYCLSPSPASTYVVGS